MNRDFSQFKRVVVYRIGSLGDTLVVLPAFHLVRQAFPEAHITLLTNIPVHAKAAPMEAVLGGGNFYDDVLRYPVSLRDFTALTRLRKVLKDGAYDCLVYLASPKGGLLTSMRDYLFFRSCGIQDVVGVPFSRYALRSLPIPGTNLYTSRTSRALEALDVLGTIEVNDPRSWDLRLSPEEIAESEEVLGRHGIDQPFLAVSAGTKMPAKDWEEHHWMELMQRLAVEYPDLPLVLFGVNEERERSERLMQVWKGPRANLCGLTSPRVSAAVLRSAKVMVCHDSGPMHLAAAMGVPCVAIFAARAKPGEWFPCGNHHVVIYHQTPCWDCGLEVCIEKEKRCILSITVDEVFVPVVQQLARRGISACSEVVKAVGANVVRDGIESGVRLWPEQGTAMGLNAPFHPVPKDEARARVIALMGGKGRQFASDGRFIVHVGDDSWNKNRRGVVEMFGELLRTSDQGNLWLVMVGKPLNRENQAQIAEAGIADRVVSFVGVAHEDLCAIYSAAELLLFPSLEEGFGWPVIEAQACGCRVVTTGRAPMNEVGSDAAAYLVPEDIHASLDILLNVLYEDERQREERVERGLANVKRYSTREMIDGYVATYDRVSRGTS